MSFAEHRSTLVDSVFDELGEAASWNGLDIVQVRRAAFDDAARTDGFDIIMRTDYIRVRKSEVCKPAIDDLVMFIGLDGAQSGEIVRVSGDPQLTRNAVWQMPVTPV